MKDISYVIGSLVSSSVISRYKEPLNLEAYYNMSFLLRDSSATTIPINTLDLWTYYTEPSKTLNILQNLETLNTHLVNWKQKVLNIENINKN